MAQTSCVFNGDPGTTLEKIVPTIIAPTATGQLWDIINPSVLNKSVGYANILSPTAHLTTTWMTTTSLRARGMLETKLVTQGNEGGSVMVFLSLLPLPYGLTISSSTYGHNVTWLPM